MNLKQRFQLLFRIPFKGSQSIVRVSSDRCHIMSKILKLPDESDKDVHVWVCARVRKLGPTTNTTCHTCGEICWFSSRRPTNLTFINICERCVAYAGHQAAYEMGKGLK